MAGIGSVVRRVDPATDRELPPLETGFSEVHRLAYSTGGEHLAIAGDSGTVRVWTPSHASLAGGFSVDAATLEDLAFSKDGGRIIVCGDGPHVRIFDWRSVFPRMAGS